MDIDLEPWVRDAFALEQGSHIFCEFRQREGQADVLFRDASTRSTYRPGVFGVTVPIAETVGDAEWQTWHPGEDYWLQPYVQFAVVVHAVEVHSTTNVQYTDADGVQWHNKPGQTCCLQGEGAATRLGDDQ